MQELITKKIPFYTSDFIIYSCLLAIQNRPSQSVKMKDFLTFASSIGVVIIRPAIKTLHTSTNLMERYQLDFDDAFVVSCMQDYGIKKLVTYDHHFDKVSEIIVVRP